MVACTILVVFLAVDITSFYFMLQPVLACQPGPRTTGTPDAEMVACKEAEQVALAELNKYLLASTYKMDFHGKGENGVCFMVINLCYV